MKVKKIDEFILNDIRVILLGDINTNGKLQCEAYLTYPNGQQVTIFVKLSEQLDLK